LSTATGGVHASFDDMSMTLSAVGTGNNKCTAIDNPTSTIQPRRRSDGTGGASLLWVMPKSEVAA